MSGSKRCPRQSGRLKKSKRSRPRTRTAILSVSYRYELRRGDEIVATGHPSPERPLEVGEQLSRRDFG